MNVIKVDLPTELKSIELHTLADLHIGDKFANQEKIHATINQIRDTENAYCILNGDLMNNATKTSVSDSYAEKFSPMQQIEMCVELLAPIRQKIIAINQGNHEYRTYKNDGVDITKVIAMELGIVDRYSPTSSVIFLRLGKQSPHHKSLPVQYTIFCLHGAGGGRKEGAKAIRLADMASIIDADIYIHSHTHLPMIMKQAYYRTSLASSSIAKVDKLFVNTASMLEYGGYGEANEFKPNSTEGPVIYLQGTHKEMRAKL